MKTKKHLFFALQLIALLGLCLSAFPSTLSSSYFHVFTRLDGLLNNLKFHVRGPKKASGDVVVVAIDRLSIETLGRWPWKRNVMAVLTESLFQLGARNIGFDIGFIEKQADEYVFDQEFEETLK
ncbi:MAG: CHASE2 domain-containing protein, partial [Pseudomonadota bacterium]